MKCKKKGKGDGNPDRGVTDDETMGKKVDGEKERAEGRKKMVTEGRESCHCQS